MSTLPTSPEQPTPIPALARTDTVVMGRLDYLSVLVRLIGVELYKLRRRPMSKVLSIIGIVLIILTFGVISIGELVTLSTPAADMLPPQCSAVANPQGPSNPNGQACLDHTPTQAELAQADQDKKTQLTAYTEPLRLPLSLVVSVREMLVVGLVLLVIVAGTIVGGEYSVGTVRLMSTRGPTRVQYILSKVGAMIVSIFIGSVFVVLIGLVVGALLNLASGVATDTSFLNNNGVVHMLLYVLYAMFGLFIYTMLALFLGTAGRATAAGVAGALVWWVLENVLSGVLGLVALFVKGPLGDVLKALPDYFISSNIDALLANQAQYFGSGAASSLSDLHAFLVLFAYLVIFIALSILISIRRDITN